MKTSRLLPVLCVNLFVAVPAFAASQPASSPSAPISLCGESKADKGKADKSETEMTDKSNEKTDKKESKEKKGDSKASA
jgi:hypothetical protein